MKKLIIHIGSPKTGSTTIQRSIANNSKFLGKNNISVIDFWSKSYPQKYLRSFLLNEVKEEMLMEQPYCDAEKLIECINGWGGIQTTDFNSASVIIKERINKCKNEYILISWEAFWDINIFKLLIKMISSVDDVKLHKIICFLRRQDTYAESRLQQIIKEGRIEDIDKYWENLLSGVESLDWNKKIIEFKDAALDTEFSVKILEFAVKGPGLLNVFYKELGITNISGMIKSERKNIHLSWSALVLAYHYQDKVKVSEFSHLMSLLSKSEFGSGGNYCFLEVRQRKQLLDIYYGSNKKLLLQNSIVSEDVFNNWMRIGEELVSRKPIDFNHPDVLKKSLIDLAGLLDKHKRYFVYNNKLITKLKSIIKILIY